MTELSKELVANAMYGDDVPRIGGVLLDLLPKAGNVVVYHTRERRVVIAPDFIQQLIARESLATTLNEVFQHSEFARG
jgi:hypothetical protein